LAHSYTKDNIQGQHREITRTALYYKKGKVRDNKRRKAKRRSHNNKQDERERGGK
jgi:hypothetical protein